MERLHLAAGFVAMTAGCVGTPRSWQCPHLWHHDALGSKTVHGYQCFEVGGGSKNTHKIWCRLAIGRNSSPTRTGEDVGASVRPPALGRKCQEKRQRRVKLSECLQQRVIKTKLFFSVKDRSHF